MPRPFPAPTSSGTTPPEAVLGPLGCPPTETQPNKITPAGGEDHSVANRGFGSDACSTFAPPRPVKEFMVTVDSTSNGHLGGAAHSATSTQCCANLSTAKTLTARAPVTQLPTGRTPPPQRPSGRYDETDSAVSDTTCSRMT
jgi:hypothetical protein